MPALPNPNWTILHNKFPPTQRVGLVRPRMFSKRRIAQLSFFLLRRSLCCSGVCGTPASHIVRRLQNEVDRTNILAPGL